MALIKGSVVVVLLLGIASASWGPSKLVVEMNDNKGDYVDLDLQWQAGECPFAIYRIFVQTPTSEKKRVGTTWKSKFTIASQEFWTSYNVTLKTSLCFVSDSLTAGIETGPGKPHKVGNLDIEASATAADITFREANMPRIVDAYNVTFCSPASCKSQSIPRSSTSDQPISITTHLEPLTPGTLYNTSVVPEIVYRQETYTGEPAVSVFVTKRY